MLSIQDVCMICELTLHTFLTETDKYILSIALNTERDYRPRISDIQSPELLIWACSTFTHFPKTYKTIDKYVYHNNILMVNTAFDLKFPWIPKVCEIAAERGHVDMLRLLYDKGCKWSFCVGNVAAANGHLDVLKFLHETGYSFYGMALIHAIKGKNLDCVKFLCELGVDCPDAIDYAICSGTYEIFEFLYTPDQSESAIESALEHDNVEVLEYLWNDTIEVRRAVEYDSVKCLEYFHKLGFRLDVSHCAQAVKSLSVKSFRYMVERGIINQEIRRMVVIAGLFDFIEVLVDSGINLQNELQELGIESLGEYQRLLQPEY